MSLRNRVRFYTDTWNEKEWCRCGDEGIYKVLNQFWMCYSCYWLVFVDELYDSGWEDIIELKKKMK